MRQRWLPGLMDRRPYNAWEEKRDGARQWAGEKARQILREYHPQPLDQGLLSGLQAVIQAAEAEYTAGD
jgi:trimethylamine:corrinoid methyltransferase-like protein